jgi:hypothetical protein
MQRRRSACGPKATDFALQRNVRFRGQSDIDSPAHSTTIPPWALTSANGGPAPQGRGAGTGSVPSDRATDPQGCPTLTGGVYPITQRISRRGRKFFCQFSKRQQGIAVRERAPRGKRHAPRRVAQRGSATYGVHRQRSPNSAALTVELVLFSPLTRAHNRETRRLLTNRPCLGFVDEESHSKRTSTRQQLDCAKTL